MSSSRSWGRAYYSEKSQPRSVAKWANLLQKKYPDLKKEVERTVKQWNLQIRDHLRNETALRLSIGSDSSQVSVKVVDGFPHPLAKVLWQYEDLALLLLHKRTLEQTEQGLVVVSGQFDSLCDLVAPMVDEDDITALQYWLSEIIGKLNETEIIKQLSSIEEDILGAYFFHEGKVEIYWMAIGITSELYGIPVAALTTVVLAHELAHAYTHLGKDIDSKKWETEKFDQADLRIVEGLAQFYTEVVCKKLVIRFPAALSAYNELLKFQSNPYKVQQEWAKQNEHQGEIIRFSMVHTRTSGITDYDRFKSFLDDQAKAIGKK